MHPLETYLQSLYHLHISGQGMTETSFIPVLTHLLDEAGQTLKPPVRCLLNLKTIGARLPDGGFFTASQFPKKAGSAMSDQPALPVTPPSRGAIEIKSLSSDLPKAAYALQMVKHLSKYPQVLVTNYRQFVLLGLDREGRPSVLESFSLAANEADFWAEAAQPALASQKYGDRLLGFLKRVMRRPVPLTRPADLAWYLASYAREAHSRINPAYLDQVETLQATALPAESPLQMALNNIRDSLEDALELTFDGPPGKHFFHLTLVQTLFYTLFSGWVLWHTENPARQDHFDWRAAAGYLYLPVIEAIWRQVVNSQQPNLIELFNGAGAALNRVKRTEFFNHFEIANVVPDFFEPFLQAFSPELTKILGVRSTPPEIVAYMLARVDTLLREEFGLTDGLADEQICLLDPCCGGGSYLVAVLRRIAATQGIETAKKAALERVFGFEIMPAAYIVAHLQLNLLLQSLPAPLTPPERAGVYLTNALTGWNPSDSPKPPLLLPELEAECEAADSIKQNRKILVILGTPPSQGFDRLAIIDEFGLTPASMRPDQTGPDLYLRFFRLAERYMIEQSGRGVIGYLSNYSWLDSPAYTGMRQRYLETFAKIVIDSLNGDKFRTGKLTPSGEPDPSVFSTRFNREGSQVGTAITLLIRTATPAGTDTVRFRQWWGKNKRQELLDSLQVVPNEDNEPEIQIESEERESSEGVFNQRFQNDMPPYQDLKPALASNLSFMPALAHPDYPTWPSLPEIFFSAHPGSTINQGKPIVRGNVWLATAKKHRRLFDPPLLIIGHNLPAVIERGVYLFPLRLQLETEGTFFADLPDTERLRPNFSQKISRYLAHLEAGGTAEILFYHLVALLYAPHYREENSGALRQDWPRVPLANTLKLLQKSALLGQKIVALLNQAKPVPGVTTGQIRPELKMIGVLHQGEDDLSEIGGNLAITAGWGSPGRAGVPVLGEGRRVERAFSPEEQATLEKGGAALGLSLDQLAQTLGDTTVDVYLNESSYWANIPPQVWRYTIGGYPVLQKWLSQQEESILGRPLKTEETLEFMHLARRILALVLLEPALDANYRAVKQTI